MVLRLFSPSSRGSPERSRRRLRRNRSKLCPAREECALVAAKKNPTSGAAKLAIDPTRFQQMSAKFVRIPSPSQCPPRKNHDLIAI
jgi:hypothetical protein